MTQYAFISYVSEDSVPARRLAEGLRAYGIDVWRDRDALHPGDRWKQDIALAIAQGAAFLCCFSAYSERRDRSYMREELLLAIQELRLRSTQRTWFIPVLLDGTRPLDDPEISAGFNLSDIQFIDMSLGWDEGVRRIIAALVSEHLPSERARLEKRLEIAEAMERLAVSESKIASEPFAALRLAASASRVTARRATQYNDLVVEAYSGIHAMYEIQAGLGYYGATHLASQNISVSTDPKVVAWAGRGGHIAVVDVESGSAQILGRVGGSIPDVFIDGEAKRIVAISQSDRLVKVWVRVGKAQWLELSSRNEAHLKGSLGTVGNRYAYIGRSLYVVSGGNEGVDFVPLPSGRVGTLPLGKCGPVGIDPTGTHLRVRLGDRLVPLRRSAGGGWVELEAWNWNEICTVSYPHETALRPFGIRVRRDGCTLLNFDGKSVILPEPGESPTWSNTLSLATWDANLLPDGKAAIGMRHGGRFRGAVTVATKSGEREDFDVGRFAGSMAGLVSFAASGDCRFAAVADENGRLLGFDLARYGPTLSGVSCYGQLPGRGMAIALGDYVCVQTGDRSIVLLCAADVPETQTFTSFRPPLGESGKLIDLQLAPEVLLTTIQVGDEIERRLWSIETQDLLWVARSPAIEGRGNDGTTEFDRSYRACLWQTSRNAVGLFDMTHGEQIGNYTFWPEQSNDATFISSLENDRVAILNLGQPLLVYELGSMRLIEKIAGTGLGVGGGAWGDSPANLLIEGGALVACKRSGSVARWHLDTLRTIGTPWDLHTQGHVKRCDIISRSEHGEAVGYASTFHSGGWLIRGLLSEDTVPRYFSGIGEYLGPARGCAVWARRADGNLWRIDLSVDAVSAAVESLVHRSRALVV